jgi:hypothetical protein
VALIGRTNGWRVGPARHGMGVFALRRYRAEQIVGEVTGRIIDDPTYGSDYCMDLGDGLCLEPEGPFRYVNHSCEPNCLLLLEEGFEEDGRRVLPKMYLQAIRAIRPNEELTIDYAWPADEAVPCECQSQKCRGWIVAATELSLLLRKRRRRPVSRQKQRVGRIAGARRPAP